MEDVAGVAIARGRQNFVAGNVGREMDINGEMRVITAAPFVLIQ